MRSLTKYKYAGDGNSLLEWPKHAHPLKVLRNIIAIEIAKYMPLGLKNKLYRAIGIKVGKNVSVAYKVTFDILFPELIEIGDNTIIGYGCTILAHEFLIKELRIGKVKIGKNVMVGANSTVLAGVTIGDNATVSAMSLVNENVPENAFAGGIPVKVLRKTST
ncbi:MAG: acyltransferase [Candidatus Aenigmarchaeota archaeon]|nr:acyltransferase [Candidatus Aenigmarchaeota archaeon]